MKALAAVVFVLAVLAHPVAAAVVLVAVLGACAVLCCLTRYALGAYTRPIWRTA